MATKDERLFAPFDIGMDEHPKIVGLSDTAFRAFFEGIFYSRRRMSDGFLDKRIVLRRWGQDAAEELCANDPERPSWVPVENGWQIRDFEKHHPLRAEIEQKRAATSEAKSAAGKKSGEARRAKAEQEANTREQETNTTGTKSNPETETQTQSETSPSNEGERSAKRGSRLSPDWMPSDASKAKARTDAPNVDHQAEHVVFVDYWIAQPGQKGVKTDWEATWRNWMRRKETDLTTRRPSGDRQTKTEKNLSVVARYAAMEQNEQLGIAQ